MFLIQSAEVVHTKTSCPSVPSLPFMMVMVECVNFGGVANSLKRPRFLLT